MNVPPDSDAGGRSGDRFGISGGQRAAGQGRVPVSGYVKLDADADRVNSGADRRRRVDLLKRLIVVAVILAFIMPTIISLLVLRSLKVSVGRLEEEISELSEAVERLDAGDTVGMNENRRVSVDGTYVGEPITWSEGTVNSYGSRIDNGKKKVCLTFDDGPSSNTGRVLDILKEYDVKATFFVLGKEGPGYADLYRRITDEGHTIGMHSYSHRYDEIYGSLDNFKADLEKIQDLIYDYTGVWPVYYRFPGGSSNRVNRIPMEGPISFLNEENIVYYDWNVAAGDADTVPVSKQQIVDRCISGINRVPHEAVVLFHDSEGKRSTVEALPEIIEQVLAMPDTEIVPITEDTIPIRHVKVTGENEDMEEQ